MARRRPLRSVSTLLYVSLSIFTRAQADTHWSNSSSTHGLGVASSLSPTVTAPPSSSRPAINASCTECEIGAYYLTAVYPGDVQEDDPQNVTVSLLPRITTFSDGPPETNYDTVTYTAPNQTLPSGQTITQTYLTWTQDGFTSALTYPTVYAYFVDVRGAYSSFQPTATDGSTCASVEPTPIELAPTDYVNMLYPFWELDAGPSDADSEAIIETSVFSYIVALPTVKEQLSLPSGLLPSDCATSIVLSAAQYPSHTGVISHRSVNVLMATGSPQYIDGGSKGSGTGGGTSGGTGGTGGGTGGTGGGTGGGIPGDGGGNGGTGGGNNGGGNSGGLPGGNVGEAVGQIIGQGNGGNGGNGGSGGSGGSGSGGSPGGNVGNNIGQLLGQGSGSGGSGGGTGGPQGGNPGAGSGPGTGSPGSGSGSLPVGGTPVPFSVGPGGGVIIGGQTIAPGQVATVNGVPISVPSTGSGAGAGGVVVVGGSTITLPAGSAGTQGSRPGAQGPEGGRPGAAGGGPIIGSQALSASGGNLLLGGTTLTSGVTVIAGTTVSIGPSGTVIIGGTTTVIPGVTSTGLGDFIASGVGGSRAPSPTASATSTRGVGISNGAGRERESRAWTVGFGLTGALGLIIIGAL